MLERRTRLCEIVGRRPALAFGDGELAFRGNDLLRDLRLEALERRDRGRVIRFGDLQRGLRLGDLALIRNGIDAGEQLPALDGLAVLDEHLDDLPFDPGCELDHVGLDEGVVGDGVAEAKPDPPGDHADEQDRQQQRGHDRSSRSQPRVNRPIDAIRNRH